MTWTAMVFGAANGAYLAGGLLGAGAALGLALGPRLRARLSARLRALPHPALAALLLGAGLPAAFAVVKLAAFHAFQLTGDSGETVHVAWKAAHGYGLHSSASSGRSYLAAHFAFTAALLSPLLRLWPSAAALAVVQGAAVASAPYAVFLLARRRLGDPLPAWLLAFAAASHPMFQDLCATFLDSGTFALPLFLWAAYCWEAGRRGFALALGLGLLTTQEQVPFIFLGLGLALCARRRVLWGTSLAAASLLVWLAELRVMEAARAGMSCGAEGNWRLFAGLGGDARSLLENALTRPWLFAAALFEPWAKLLTPARGLIPLAFLPLAGGAAALPALTAWAPHQLADLSTSYHRLVGHYPAFVLGPLLWAAVAGYDRLSRRLPKARLRAAAALLLALGAWSNLRFAGYYRDGLLPSSWRTAVPRMTALIPDDSKVWCDTYLLPHLALRPFVKALPAALPRCSFEEGLFMPDRVLLSTFGLRLSDPATRDRLLSFLRANGFRRSLEDRDLILFEHPDAPAIAAGPPRFLKLP